MAEKPAEGKRQIVAAVSRYRVAESSFDDAQFVNDVSVLRYLPNSELLARCICRVMNKIYLLQLNTNDLGQIIEGLQVREESWRKTAEYFRSGYNPDDSFLIEECNGEHEANQIALFYARIIRSLERQRDEQPNSERELYLQGKSDGQDNLIQRILVNWKLLNRMGPIALHRRLLELRDEICDK